MADRLVERPLIPSPVASEPQVLGGFASVGRRQPVVRDQPVDALWPLPVKGFEPLGGPPVQRRSLCSDQRPVGRLLDQGVLEAVDGVLPYALLPQQVKSQEVVQRLAQRWQLEAGDCLEQPVTEGAPQHGGRGQDLAPVRLKPIDASDDHALERLRYLERALPGEPPAPVLRDQRSAVDQRPDHLFQVEGIAFRITEQLFRNLFRDRPPSGKRAQQHRLGIMG